MTSTIAASGPPAAAGKNGEQLTWTRKDLWRARALTILYSALVGIVEALFSYQVLVLIVEDSLHAWIAAFITVFTANALAYGAAVKAHTSKPMAWALGAAWLALGIALVWIRIQESKFVEPKTDISGGTTGLDASTSGMSDNHVLMAGLLAVFFISAGILAFSKASAHSHPALAARIAAAEKHQEALKAYVPGMGNSHHATQQLAHRLAEIDEVPEDLKRHEASIATGIARAKHAARVRLAERLGDVTATTGLTHLPLSGPQHDPGVPANDGPATGEEGTPAR